MLALPAPRAAVWEDAVDPAARPKRFGSPGRGLQETGSLNLRQLSDLLRLSPTTVSRALAGYPEVNEDTRRRVHEAARRHDYRPNRRAAALATGRAMAIGHVVADNSATAFANPVFADFVSGASEIYARDGYDMVLSVVQEGQEVRAHRQLAANGSVDGLIVHGPHVGDPRFDALRAGALPFVVHGRMPGADWDYDFVDVDNHRAFRRAADLLLDLGHRRIALLNGPEPLDFARRRLDGVHDALAARGIAPDRLLARHGEMSEQAAHAAAAGMLAATDPPTAFLASSLLMAFGVRRAVQDAGLAVGRDVSIVTHDDMLSYLSNGGADAGDVPPFTATRSSVRAAGRRCAEILLARIVDPDAPRIREVWESDLVRGASTGPVAA